MRPVRQFARAGRLMGHVNSKALPVRVLGLPPFWIGLLLASILLAICFVVAILLAETRESEMKRASLQASSLSAAVTQDLARNFELFDQSIQGVIEGVQNPAVMSAPAALQHLILFDRAATATDLGVLLVLDTKGDIVIDSGSATPRLFNYADRDYFAIHVGHTGVGLFVSKPLVSRIDGKMIIGLSRRINKPDGSFGGVVVGTFHLDYIHRLFSGATIGANSSLVLFRRDGVVMMREPYDLAQIGKMTNPVILFDHLDHNPQGEYQASSIIDGTERLIHYQQVGTLPLVQVVALSIDDIFAVWWQKTIMLSIVLATCCAIIAVLAFALNSELRRRTRAEASLFRLATEDPLTGLANRRSFEERLWTEWQRSLRHRTGLSLLMIDADQFKSYNDAFGHPAGDKALAALAKCLSAKARRPEDLAARYGGEEFAVVLPMIDSTSALAFAESLRVDVSALALPHPASSWGRFTISVGVATIPAGSAASLKELVSTADSALYESKHGGRNRSTVQALATLA